MKRIIALWVVCLLMVVAQSVVAVEMVGFGGTTGPTELLSGRFQTDTTGWHGFSGVGAPLGTVAWVSTSTGRWTNSSLSYRGVQSDTFSVSSGDEITVSFTTANEQGVTMFFFTDNNAGSYFGGSTAQIASGTVAYTFTSNATSSTVTLVFWSSGASDLSGTDIINVSVKKR
jgi:hypothetical protein